MAVTVNPAPGRENSYYHERMEGNAGLTELDNAASSLRGTLGERRGLVIVDTADSADVIVELRGLYDPGGIVGPPPCLGRRLRLAKPAIGARVPLGQSVGPGASAPLYGRRCRQRFFRRRRDHPPAYAGLSWVWGVRGQMGIMPTSETGPKAKVAALQAIALDDNSAEGHEALASTLTWNEWNWSAAGREWTRALELNPNAANAHAYYAHYLANMGRAAEGVAHSERAIKLDPFNPLYHSLYGMVLVYLRRYDDAMAAAHASISIRADQSLAFSVIQRVYLSKGMRKEQLADQRLRIAKDPERVAAFDRGLAAGGYEGAQRAIADVLAARYEKGQYRDAAALAMRYLDAGDRERAISWLYKAYDIRDQNLPYLGMPHWDPLRSDPRFQALMRRVGLPQ